VSNQSLTNSETVGCVIVRLSLILTAPMNVVGRRFLLLRAILQLDSAVHKLHMLHVAAASVFQGI
ncbi:hypothetical protein, partial [Corynebacterium sp.]|uniref:hypothetical protein n=1 Tax=Corynebacterium sp. TaxID=1720 RepID=UPI0028A66F0E